MDDASSPPRSSSSLIIDEGNGPLRENTSKNIDIDEDPPEFTDIIISTHEESKRLDLSKVDDDSMIILKQNQKKSRFKSSQYLHEVSTKHIVTASESIFETLIKRRRYLYEFVDQELNFLGFDDTTLKGGVEKQDGGILKKMRKLSKSPKQNDEDMLRPAIASHIVADNEEITVIKAKEDIKMISKELEKPLKKGKANLSTQGKKLLSASDEIYRKPFDFGWRRELVWRANIEASRDKADVYYISPKGKKLRTRNEVYPHITPGLTIDNFCFSREPLGASPEFETVRSAKPSLRAAHAAALIAAATPTAIGKRVSKPKGPKGASPPPEGWTPTRALKVNNAALLSNSAANRYTGSLSDSISSGRNQRNLNAFDTKKIKPKVSLIRKSTSSSSTVMNDSVKLNTSNCSMSVPDTTSGKSLQINNRALQHEPCSSKCSKAAGELPELQCMKCLCLFHHDCVGLSRHNIDYKTSTNSRSPKRSDYVCEACCSSKKMTKESSAYLSGTATATSMIPTTIATTTSRSSSKSSSASSLSLKNSNLSTSISSTQSGGLLKMNSTNMNQTSTTLHQTANSASRHSLGSNRQTLNVAKGKKYVMVSKPQPPNNEQLTDVQNELKQMREYIRNNKKSIASPLDLLCQNQNNAAIGAAAQQANKDCAMQFFAHASCAYVALLNIFKYLKIHERGRAASVCKLWNVASKDTSLWHTVRMKNSKVCNWAAFASALRRGETKHLDLRKMLLASGTRSEELWHAFSEHIGSVTSLEIVDLCRCSSKVVEHLFESNRNMKILNAMAIVDENINLEKIILLEHLIELRLRAMEPLALSSTLKPLKWLKNLSHLSLTSIRNLGEKSIEVIGELTDLHSLELGECGDFDGTFAERVLPKLVNLHRLRLENGQETNCCTLEILDAVCHLENLNQLEVINFDIKPGFEEKLCLCTNIQKLLIIPTYISQSATTNHIVLSAVQQVADTLKVFTWGVTVELLRVTALYVGQCEESTKKDKYLFEECIPVLKPVPGATTAEDDENAVDNVDNNIASDNNENDGNTNIVPQIEILPLDKVEIILGNNLPNTRFTIVKVPYHATCKQQLVE